MERKPLAHFQAHDLYFQTELTQQQIADILNVHRKTVHLWIKDGRWKHIKYAAGHAPCTLIEGYYEQLSALNMKIAMREDQPWATKEESEIIRRLSSTIKQIRNGKHTLSESMEVFEHFTSKLKRKDRDLAIKLVPHLSEHVTSLSDKGRLLKGDIRRLEQQEEDEYQEWLAQQEEEAKRKQGENEAQNVTTIIPETPSKPLPTAQINENVNMDLSTKKDGNTGNLDLSLPAKAIATEGTKKSENEDNQNTRHCEEQPVPILRESNPENSAARPQLTINDIMKWPPGIRPSPFRDGNNIWVKDLNDINDPLDDLGEPWGIVNPGDVVRLYPNEQSYDQTPPLELTIRDILILPPEDRPSPFRDGNILWVNNIDDVDERLNNFGQPWGERKIGDSIRRYSSIQ